MASATPGSADPGRVLVTGAAGFIGAAVVRRLAADGHAVVALVRDAAAAPRLAPLRGRIDVVEADLTDAGALGAAVRAARPGACVHLAAAGGVAGRADVERLLAANVVGTARLAEALAAAECRRLVSAGSSSEYGPAETAMAEAGATRPDDVYGVSKLAAGLLAHAICAGAGMTTMHLRIFSAYGPGEHPRRLVPAVAARLLRGEPVDLTPGEQVRDLVYIEDVVDAFARALAAPDSGVAVNVGSGRQTTVREACLLLAELAGADPALLRFGSLPYRDGERFAWRAATEEAERRLGWRATTSLRDGLARTLDALRARPA